MNWLQKISSITFDVEGSHKISQPKTILTICHNMAQWFYQNGPKAGQQFNAFEPDGDDFDKYTGTINWYTGNELDPGLDDVNLYVQQYAQQELNPLGIHLGPIRPDISNLSKERVYRISVVKNETDELTEMPYVNMSNRNAGVVMALLGISEIKTDSEFNMLGLDLSGPADYTGSISATELIQRIDQAGYKLQSFTISPDEGKVPGGAHYIDMGIDENYLKAALDRLRELATWAIRHDFNTIVWA